MKELLLRSILTKNLKESEIFDICKIKNTHWKYGIKSQLNWFKKYIRDNDIHNLAYLEEKLVGYGLLRNRSFVYKKIKKNYLYYDTLVISKKYRKLRIGKKLSELIIKTIKKLKLHAMLICEKKIVDFHKKYEWKKKEKSKSQILDHKYSKKLSMMCFNQKEILMKCKIEYFIFS
tara:strand:+ start:767 stop:1291 length:525 start_codon:yes stop_codon:yes gene_type:complete